VGGALITQGSIAHPRAVRAQVAYFVWAVTNLAEEVMVHEPKPRGGGQGGAPVPTVDEMIARVQRLCEAPRSHGAFPVPYYVEGYLLGDSTAIIAAKLRAEGLHRS
jgi:hypothetical protein